MKTGAVTVGIELRGYRLAPVGSSSTNAADLEVRGMMSPARNQMAFTVTSRRACRSQLLDDVYAASTDRWMKADVHDGRLAP